MSEKERVVQSIMAQSEELEELFWNALPSSVDVPHALLQWISENVEEAVLEYAQSLIVMWELNDNGCIIGQIGSIEFDTVPNVPLDFGRDLLFYLRTMEEDGDTFDKFAQALEALAAQVRQLAKED